LFGLLEVNHSLSSLNDYEVDVGGEMVPTGELPVGVIFASLLQAYAIAMKDGKPFGLGGLWKNWKEPTSGE
jgi:hypothetical protein